MVFQGNLCLCTSTAACQTLSEIPQTAKHSTAIQHHGTNSKDQEPHYLRVTIRKTVEDIHSLSLSLSLSCSYIHTASDPAHARAHACSETRTHSHICILLSGLHRIISSKELICKCTVFVFPIFQTK